MPHPIPQCTLETERLRLRPFTLADAPAVQALAGAREVASTTLTIPHPYEDGMAEAWIETHAPRREAGELANFALVEKETEQLVGAMGLVIQAEHARAELGYWVGVPFWNRGYATEAARVVLRFGFEELGLNRIYAMHLVRNPASGRVMQKVGMQYEGRLRQHVQKWGTFEDLDVYGIVAEEWRGQHTTAEVRSVQGFRPVIESPPSYTPAIGHRVSMLGLVRLETRRLVANLSADQLAHRHDERSNSIGALLGHLAAVERTYQIISFEERSLTAAEEQMLNPALDLSREFQEQIRGRTARELLTELEEIRALTLRRLAERGDTWLPRRPIPGDEMVHHWIWFHVMEDEIRHCGQIAWLRSRLPSRA